MNGSQYQEAELAMNANSYTVESGIATKFFLKFHSPFPSTVQSTIPVQHCHTIDNLWSHNA